MIKYILFFLFPLIIFSQKITSFSDSDHIEEMNDHLNLKLGIDNDISEYEFNDSNNSYSIVPNTDLRTTLSVNHRFISFKISYSPEFLSNNNEELKGTTKVFRIQTDIFFKRWIQTLEYWKIKGYYIEGITNSETLFDDPEFILLPELKTSVISGTTRYVFNKNYSAKAVVNQHEIQRKSAGSFIPSLTYGYFEIKDKTSPQELSTIGLILNTGYFHTFVISHKWYSNLGISPGLGVEFNKLTIKSEEHDVISRNEELIFSLESHVGLGYNSKSFFGGIYFKVIGTSREENSIVKFNTARGIVQIFIGYRFKTPKFVEKSTDWIEDQNPVK